MYEIRFTYVDKCLIFSVKINHKIIKKPNLFCISYIQIKGPVINVTLYTKDKWSTSSYTQCITYNKRAANGTLRFQEAPSFLSYAPVRSVMHAWTFLLRYCQHVNFLMITTMCTQIKLFLYSLYWLWERSDIDYSKMTLPVFF